MSAPINTGGSAFPDANTLNSKQGMTLRDYFAAMALAAYMSDSKTQVAFKALAERAGLDFRAAIADASFEIADAMLAARERKESAT